jgi:predicted TIM-barrel fold metal-dependent hydrolase
LPSAGPTIRAEDDPFWDAAQSLGVPVHFHVRLLRQVTKPHPKGIRGDTLHGLAGNGAQAALTDVPEIIASGVHDRFPRLVWVAAETGAGWIPYILEQLDDRWWRNRSWLPVKLHEAPSVYFRRNWRVTFMIDHVAVENREAIGVDNLMWSTDYPHHGCDWPETRRGVTAMFRDVPTSERRALCATNATKLYGLG